MAKMKRFFIAPLGSSVAGNGTATYTYQNSGNQKFNILQIAQRSTGIFDITDFSNNAGFQYANASASNPLSGSAFPDMNEDTDSLELLPIPIVLEGQEQIRITVVDTSTSTNVIAFVLVGFLEIDEG